jgi:hypothetical protein
MPRMTTADRDTITGPAAGLFVYNTSDNKFQFYNGSTWSTIDSAAGGATGINGAGVATQVSYFSDADTITSSSNMTFDGTKLTVNQFQMTNGAQNGYVLTSDVSGNATWTASTDANGLFSSSNDGGTVSTAFNVNLTDTLTFGTDLLRIDETNGRIGVGTSSTPSETLHVGGVIRTDGYINMSGQRFIHTTYNGVENVTGGNNTLIGYLTPTGLTNIQNTVIGSSAFTNATDSRYNVIVGESAASNVVTARDLVAVGKSALSLLNPSTQNSSQGTIGIGTGALGGLTDGAYNVAIGLSAGLNVTGGGGNIFIGYNSGAKTSGSYNHSLAIGREARITGSNQIVFSGQASGAGFHDVYWGVGVEETTINPTVHRHWITSISEGQTDNTPNYEWQWYASAGTGTGQGSGFEWFTAPAGSSGTASNAHVTAMRITGAGDVGIGTSNPSAKLHTLTGAFTFNGTTDVIKLANSTWCFI